MARDHATLDMMTSLSDDSHGDVYRRAAQNDDVIISRDCQQQQRRMYDGCWTTLDEGQRSRVVARMCCVSDSKYQQTASLSVDCSGHVTTTTTIADNNNLVNTRPPSHCSKVRTHSTTWLPERMLCVHVGHAPRQAKFFRASIQLCKV